jgi:hypothetical protein
MDAADQVANDDFGEANEGASADEEDEPSDEEPQDDAPVDQLSELQGCLDLLLQCCSLHPDQRKAIKVGKPKVLLRHAVMSQADPRRSAQ